MHMLTQLRSNMAIRSSAQYDIVQMRIWHKVFDYQFHTLLQYHNIVRLSLLPLSLIHSFFSRWFAFLEHQEATVY
jgi:hypothetical protein